MIFFLFSILRGKDNNFKPKHEDVKSTRIATEQLASLLQSGQSNIFHLLAISGT